MSRMWALGVADDKLKTIHNLCENIHPGMWSKVYKKLWTFNKAKSLNNFRSTMHLKNSDNSCRTNCLISFSSIHMIKLQNLNMRLSKGLLLKNKGLNIKCYPVSNHYPLKKEFNAPSNFEIGQLFKEARRSQQWAIHQNSRKTSRHSIEVSHEVRERGPLQSKYLSSALCCKYTVSGGIGRYNLNRVNWLESFYAFRVHWTVI